MLRQLHGEIDPVFVARRLIECALHRLRSDPSDARGVSYALYQLAMDVSLPPGQLKKDAWWFYDAIDLAASGYCQETPVQIVQKMIDSLKVELDSMNKE